LTVHFQFRFGATSGVVVGVVVVVVVLVVVVLDGVVVARDCQVTVPFKVALGVVVPFTLRNAVLANVTLRACKLNVTPTHVAPVPPALVHDGIDAPLSN
jgi:hypothetical protein